MRRLPTLSLWKTNKEDDFPSHFLHVKNNRKPREIEDCQKLCMSELLIVLEFDF